jgi:hypothetical protein
MTMTNNKVGRGSLRAVEPTPTNERAPTYKGSVEIQGKKFWLSGWRRMGDDGKYWLSLSVETADQAAPSRPAMATRDHREMDDDIPFWP